MKYEPTKYEQIRHITHSERAALIAANVLPHLPNGDRLLVVEDRVVSDSPYRNGHLKMHDYNERDRFVDYAQPVAPNVNLYRVEVDDSNSIIGGIPGIRQGEGDVMVDTVPHSDHGPYELHVSDFRAMRRPDSGDYDYDNPQMTFGNAKLTHPGDYERESRLPI